MIHIVYHHVLQQSYLGEWLSHVKNILCINGFGKVWIDQGVTNQNRFLKALEERCHDIYAQQCLSEIHESNRCRMYKEVKLSFSVSFYVGLNIHKYLRIYFTKLKLSCHKFLVERSRWVKPKVSGVARGGGHLPPGAARRGAPKSCQRFFKNLYKVKF